MSAAVSEYLKTGKGEPPSGLSSDEMLVALHQTLLPESQRQGKHLTIKDALLLIWLLPVILLIFDYKTEGVLPFSTLTPQYIVPVALVAGVWVVFSLLSRRLFLLWLRSVELLPAILPGVQSPASLSAMIDLVGWFETFGGTMPVHSGSSGGKHAALQAANDYSDLKLLARKTLMKLLSLEWSPDSLTESNRQVLLKLARNAENEVDLGISALQALGAIREERARPLAQKLKSSFLPRIREAAGVCLSQLDLT